MAKDLDPEDFVGRSLNLADLCEIDKKSRIMVSNRTCVGVTNEGIVATQLRGLWFYKGYAESKVERAHDEMFKWKHFAEVAVMFPQDECETLEEKFDAFAQKFGIVRRNKSFLLNVYAKALSQSPYVDDIRKTYLYNKDIFSLSKKILANVNPVLGFFLKSWKDFQTVFSEAKDVLIVEDEKFNVWSRLITRLMVAAQDEHFEEFLMSLEGRMICNRVSSLKRYVYRYIDYASSLGDAEKLKTYVRSRLEFCARMEESIKTKTFQPVVIELNGDAGVGKSHTIGILAKHFAKLLGMDENDVVYFRPSAAKYWTGYCGQPIVLYDDFNQDPRVDELNELVHIASGVPFEVPCADIVDKGIIFSSDLIILTTNEAVADMNCSKIKCKDALLRRITYTLDCKVKPACAKLIGDKLQYRGGLLASRLYRGRYEFDPYGFSAWCEALVRENHKKQIIPEVNMDEDFEVECELGEMMNMDFDCEVSFPDSVEDVVSEPEPEIEIDDFETSLSFMRDILSRDFLSTKTPSSIRSSLDLCKNPSIASKLMNSDKFSEHEKTKVGALILALDGCLTYSKFAMLSRKTTYLLSLQYELLDLYKFLKHVDSHYVYICVMRNNISFVEFKQAIEKLQKECA